MEALPVLVLASALSPAELKVFACGTFMLIPIIGVPEFNEVIGITGMAITLLLLPQQGPPFACVLVPMLPCPLTI